MHVSLSAPQSTASPPDVFLSVSCARLDFQVADAVQLCTGLSATLQPRVEELVLGFHYEDGGALLLPEEWRGKVDPGQSVAVALGATSLRRHAAGARRACAAARYSAAATW